MNWIDEANSRMEKSRLLKKEAGLTESLIKRKQASYEGGIANKGRKHSDEIKKVWSEKKIGHKRTNNSIQKSINGCKETKWKQLLEKYPLEIIIKAQKNNGNHQKNTCDELGISFYSYKKLCNHYNIELKKSASERAEFAKNTQSQPILVWKCKKNNPLIKVGKPKEYYSVNECCRSFTPKLHKGNLIRNILNGKPYRNMIFEYKK